ncbi:SAM-dependent methyltransferase [Lentisphaera marina]|uniref:16S rRNA (cytidine(1402)-2'-O)-methyltransferase n=1 Tax=Lentisphaera marina TaxID=1111041 RepID=UPI002365DF70|nr:SAM-dependent methyltransferase [Lentisphaera marina]MDD7984841.1 SAM-dependent methyltransferase [Lentisphaera marina]
MKGKLIMASGAIGNTEDIPKRTLDAVRDSDMLVFEEDRPARAVLKAAKVHREYWKYSEQDEVHTLREVEKALKRGETVCYMSDQGCPTLEDPGSPVLKSAWSVKAQIQVIPGPSSVTAAISACPFSVKGIVVAGFLSRDQELREKELRKLSGSGHPFLVMDTPYRIRHILESLQTVLDPQKKFVLAVDISGEHEAYFYNNATEILAEQEKLKPKLNFVIIVEGKKEKGQLKQAVRGNGYKQNRRKR